MDDREFEKILASAEQLRLREKQAELGLIVIPI